MEANKERCQVHMLPTEDKVIEGSLISRTFDDKLAIANCLTVDDKDAKRDGHINNYLYFTTDEEIKEGDWFIWLKYNIVERATKKDNNKECRKIISSTDPKLCIECTYKGDDKCKSLPQPSQAFIKAYCEQGGFDEVDVEYECHKVWDKRTEELLEKYFTLKLDLRGLITIHHIVQKMYIGIVKYKNTKERVEQPRIGHHTTSSLKFILKWEQQTEKLDHVDYCQVYKLLNQNKEDE